MQSPHVQIHHRRAETRMAQQTTDGQQIDSGLQKSGRIRMSERVGRDMFENARVFGGHFEHLLNRRWLEWRVGRLAGKQIHFRTIGDPDREVPSAVEEPSGRFASSGLCPIRFATASADCRCR